MYPRVVLKWLALSLLKFYENMKSLTIQETLLREVRPASFLSRLIMESSMSFFLKLSKSMRRPRRR